MPRLLERMPITAKPAHSNNNSNHSTKQKGSPAKFTWQTILILRIAVLLRNQFSVELQAHKMSFAALRKQLRLTSFIALWGRRLALGPKGGWSLLEEGAQLAGVDALVIHLDEHLAIIRDVLDRALGKSVEKVEADIGNPRGVGIVGPPG